MKIKVTMKDPDTLQDAIADAVKDELGATDGIDQDERELLADSRSEKYAEIAETWFRYGEYLTVEIDTAARTCTVLPAERSS
jgi:hypothetical protein